MHDLCELNVTKMQLRKSYVLAAHYYEGAVKAVVGDFHQRSQLDTAMILKVP